MENGKDKTNFDVATASVEKIADYFCMALHKENPCYNCFGCESLACKNKLIFWLKGKSDEE